jgi:histidinol-phosphatase (PHP family)
MEMLKVDYHVHSAWSPDSRMEVTKALEYCRANKIKEIVFTEHLDVGDPGQVPLIDLKAYRENLQLARLSYPDLSIGIGLELGVHEGNLSETQSYIAPWEWDFLILSLHEVLDMGCCNPTMMQFYDSHTILEAYWTALIYITRQMTPFHVLGHIDYLLRYQAISEEEFLSWEEAIDQVLLNLVSHGQGLEINAKGIQSLGRPHPPLNILKRFKALGGEIVTLGSDAHSAKSLSQHYEIMLSYLREAGFSYYARRNFAEKSFYFEKI